MGTFSDVALAIKKDSFEALSADAKSFLKEYADDTFNLDGDRWNRQDFIPHRSSLAVP